MELSRMLGVLTGCLLITLLLYTIFKAIIHKGGASKLVSKVVAFGIVTVVCLGLISLTRGPAGALPYVGAAVFWVVVDTLRGDNE